MHRSSSDNHASARLRRPSSPKALRQQIFPRSPVLVLNARFLSGSASLTPPCPPVGHSRKTKDNGQSSSQLSQNCFCCLRQTGEKVSGGLFTSFLNQFTFSIDNPPLFEMSLITSKWDISHLGSPRDVLPNLPSFIRQSVSVLPLIGACCELGWCEPVKARVRSVGVVVDPPFFDDLTRVLESIKQMLVEALIPQTAVEAFDKAILHRFTRRDVVPFDATLLLPKRMAFEVNSVPLSLTIMQG